MSGCKAKRLALQTLPSLLVLPAAMAASTAGAPAASHSRGVVVESLASGRALERAGVRAGDLLLAWRRLAAPPANPDSPRGEIRSVFDWHRLVAEEAPRAAVVLRGERDGERRDFRVEPGLWDAELRPRIPPALLDVYLRGEEEPPADDRLLLTWLRLRAGETAAAAGDRQSALAEYRAALAAAPDSRSRVTVWNVIATLHELHDEPREALAARRAALEIRAATWGESLELAESHHDLGRLATARGQWELAERHNRRALAIRQKLAPGSLAVAHSLNNLGIVLDELGELDEAAEAYRRAFEIQKRLADGTAALASILTNRGVVARRRGDLDQASRYHRQALEIRQKLAPGGGTVAGSFINLGAVALSRGDLDTAVHFLEQALEILEGIAPVSYGCAMVLNNLGVAALEAGDLDAAAAFHARAAEVWRQLGPERSEVAQSFNNLGLIAARRGDVEEATDYYRRALGIWEATAPNGLELADSLENLGAMALARGDLGSAEERFAEALEIRDKLAPESAEVARALDSLSSVHLARRQYQAAADLSRRAVEVLEGQIGKLGGSHAVEAGFRGRFSHIYSHYIESLVELGKNAEAFQVLERYRARSLLEMLRRRALVPADVPAELARARRRLGAAYDRAQRRLAGLRPDRDAAEIEELLGSMRGLRAEREELAAELRRAAPRVAALEEPRALDLSGGRAAVDPGTVLLAYSVGEESSRVFAVTAGGELEVAVMPVGADRLRGQVELFRELIHDARPGSRRMASLDALGRDLFSTLIGPVAEAVSAGERLLVLPDGPLHFLPFSALVLPGAADRRYLVEWKPVHFILSATLYAELRQPRHRESVAEPMPLVAFGDPLYPELRRAGPHDSVDLRVRSALDRGFDFEPLPSTRMEVEGIAALFRDRAEAFLGPRATEERLKTIAPRARWLHIAAHGFYDPDSPLDSGVALTIPSRSGGDRDNGLLQAWEIVEELRLDADLVVLSACDSGLGRELGGEGLIGLTRSLFFAGARSVAASLWEVADRSTPVLMERFYRELKAGAPKDEALRAAQVEMIRGPIRVRDDDGRPVELDASAPYYWAAFQLHGDRRP